MGLLAKWTRQYGPIFRVRGVPIAPQAVFVAHPDMLKRVLQTGFMDGVYGKPPFFRKQFADLFGNGIFNSNGAVWKAHREFAKTLFTPDRLR